MTQKLRLLSLMKSPNGLVGPREDVVHAMAVLLDRASVDSLRLEADLLGIRLLASTNLVEVASRSSEWSVPLEVVAVEMKAYDVCADQLLEALEVLSPRPAVILAGTGPELSSRWFDFSRLLVLPDFPNARALACLIVRAAADPRVRAVERFVLQFKLSRTERRVLELGVRGLHAKAIAEHLMSAPATVDSHWKRILRKSGRFDRGTVIAEVLTAATSGSPFPDIRGRARPSRPLPTEMPKV
jgi:DNA-binding CsgD family transcriptional regulator